MKNPSTLINGVLLVIVLALYMVTFQVDYNQYVVLATFGDADEDSVYAGPPELGAEAGFIGNLHFKWPTPIQTTYVYDARVQTLETQIEQLLTADDQTIAVSLFVAWRIDRPLDFYTALREMSRARSELTSRLRDAQNILARYSFTELVGQSESEEAGPSPLQQAERDIADHIQRSVDADGYGIEIMAVGIKQMVFPSGTVEQFFEQMRSTRQLLAGRAKDAGEAEAQRIRGAAEAARQTIMSFADKRAEEIRAEAAEAVADVFEQFKADEEFANFLAKIRALRQMIDQQTTIVADPELVPLDLFEQQQFAE